MVPDTAKLGVLDTDIPSLLVIEPGQMIKNMLLNKSDNGIQSIEHTQTGMDGISLAKSAQPDLIVCDIDVQQPNGFEVLKILQSSSKTRTIPVVLIGRDHSRQSYRSAISHGAEDYLSKPFEVEELCETIKARLAKRQLLDDSHASTLSELRKNITYALPHEFRTPLMMILGYSDLLATDSHDVKPEFIRESAMAILTAGRRLERLTENYLVYIQLEMIASDEKERKKFNRHLIAHTRDIIEVAASTIAEQNERANDIQFDLVDSPMRISQENLTKIVTELVDNACKFSQSGDAIIVKSRRVNKTFQLYIADNGRGMSKAQIQKMGGYMQFERFHHEQQGIGMGFIVAKRLIELHKGRINIKSKPEQGTIISISFPL